MKPSLLTTYKKVPKGETLPECLSEESLPALPKLNLLEGVFDSHKKVTDGLRAAVREIEKSRKLLTISQDASVLEPCGICMANMGNDFFPLSNCGHLFDEACMKEYILIKMEEAHFPITCPQSGCTRDLLISDLSALLSE